MTDKKPIKEGDLVTVTLNEYQVVSNTYVVVKKLEGECVLSHPLAPECLILKSDDQLNNNFPSMQNAMERCLFFAKKNREYLGHTMACDLDAMSYFFVIHKNFSPKQRQDLANICGKIASIVLGNNMTSAIIEIKQNKALLDEYNASLLNNVKRILDDPRNSSSKADRYTIFNMAGFILAQLSNS